MVVVRWDCAWDGGVLQLASDGNLEDSNKYIQLIMDSLAADESDSAMELKAKKSGVQRLRRVRGHRRAGDPIQPP